jgi:ubiquinone/menaquinone biosynthesis C-methylase UbiE
MDARIRREKDFHNKSFKERSRSVLSKYYSTTKSSQSNYEQFLQLLCKGKTVLEYGCGPGSHAFFLARNGAIVTGIDISEVAINQAIERATQENLKIDFRVMNAEELGFDRDSFDIICGTAILHHLQLERAFSELVRVMRPNGEAIFLEPLGHNPLINLYRRYTPHLRTPDEHPLLMPDLELTCRYFGRVDTRFFHLISIIATPFHKLRSFRALLGLLDSMDSVLFKISPSLRRYAWIVILHLAHPLKSELED